MKRSFSKIYEIIYNNYKKSEFSKEFGNSKLGLARLLGASQGKTQHWEKGQWPHADDLMVLHAKLGFSYRWLVTGDGEPFDAPSPPERHVAQEQHTSAEDMLAPSKPAQAIPLIGFAGCSTMGWHGTMTYPIAATAPHARPGMIAVMASGESMLPAGIGHGHICFCDPSAEPMPGECVYVACHDNKHTLKTFLGWGAAEGHKIHEGELVLRGWLDKHENEQQKDIVIHINRKLVKVIAPVVYVQRRL